MLEIFLRPDQSRPFISFFAICFALLFLTFCYVVNFFHGITDSVTEIVFDVLKQISLLLGQEFFARYSSLQILL